MEPELGGAGPAVAGMGVGRYVIGGDMLFAPCILQAAKKTKARSREKSPCHQSSAL